MLKGWLSRHRCRKNLFLHIIGIPLTIVAAGLILFWLVEDDTRYLGLAFFLLFVGYGFQFIGHHIEGNDPGEVILVKKLLGVDYIDIAPQYKGGVQKDKNDDKRLSE